jgi:hypothetical protein
MLKYYPFNLIKLFLPKINNEVAQKETKTYKAHMKSFEHIQMASDFATKLKIK